MAQARWVLEQLEKERLTIPQVHAALIGGAFKIPDEP
jgi:hypothetical protein